MKTVKMVIRAVNVPDDFDSEDLIKSTLNTLANTFIEVERFTGHQVTEPAMKPATVAADVPRP